MMTPEDEIEIEDVEDALKRADELAELTGRRKTDIVADLLDDGKLNRSAGSDIDVKKDMLDIAQEKAEKFKHLITTLLPVLALLMGVGAEGLGVLDITGWGEESVWGDDDPLGPPPIRWGCMDVNADNFDETAQQDDGSCSYEPPDCDSNWQWENVVIRSADLNGEGFNNDLEIELDFRDDNWCNDEMDNGHFSLVIEKDGQIWDQWQIGIGFQNEHHIYESRMNLQPGDYRVAVGYQRDGGNWLGPSALVNMEAPPECDDDIVVNQLVLSNNGDDLNLYVEFQDNNDCGADIEMKLSFYKNGDYTGNQYLAANNYRVHEEGQTYFNINQDDTDDMRDLEDGDWKVEFRWYIIGEDETCCDMTNTVTIDEIPDLEPCEISVDNMAASLDEDDAEQDAITISFYLAVDEETDCTDDVKITYKLEDGATIMQHQVTAPMADGEFDYTFDDVPVGSWHPIVRVDDENGYELEGDDVADVEVEEPPRCDINLYDIYFAHNGNDTAGVWYDLDCGTGPNQGVGFNVSIQFDIKIHNTTEILDYNVSVHFIEGYVEDTHSLMLTNISNGTYCFNWVAIWVDEDGQQHTITQTWENIEMAGTEGDD